MGGISEMICNLHGKDSLLQVAVKTASICVLINLITIF